MARKNLEKELNVKNSLSHTVWECKYHVVWVPKCRRKIVYGELRKELRTILQKLCKYKGIDIIEGTLCVDHVHMCLAIPPKYAVSTMVGYLKGKSAMIMFEKYSRLKRNFKGHSFWARGYYVNTVGLDEAKVRKYIKDQETNESVEDRWDLNPDSDPF
ncbi:MAG: IS200/IS605 family transposase [Desulfobacteraceae bacterium]|nr:MAG: IS200/IS605 family transposase [Desulfobacteraceae bacterium]